MSWFQNFWAHLHTVRHHRKLVRQHCFAVGLYRQGLLHDLSKYSPIEFFAGVRYFQGNRSPNDAQRKAVGYSASWLHHKGRNRHHLEYWIDYSAHGKHRMEGMEMPVSLCGGDVLRPHGGEQNLPQKGLPRHRSV